MKHLLARAARARRGAHGRRSTGVGVLRPLARRVRLRATDGFGGDSSAIRVSSYRLMVGYQFMEHLGRRRRLRRDRHDPRHRDGLGIAGSPVRRISTSRASSADPDDSLARRAAVRQRHVAARRHRLRRHRSKTSRSTYRRSRCQRRATSSGERARLLPRGAVRLGSRRRASRLREVRLRRRSRRHRDEHDRSSTSSSVPMLRPGTSGRHEHDAAERRQRHDDRVAADPCTASAPSRRRRCRGSSRRSSASPSSVSRGSGPARGTPTR